MCFVYFFFLMIRRPPRSTLDRSSAASDVYKRQAIPRPPMPPSAQHVLSVPARLAPNSSAGSEAANPVSYTHLRAHETVLDLVCRLLLEKKKNTTSQIKDR